MDPKDNINSIMGPDDLEKLQTLAEYSPKKLKDVLVEFSGNGQPCEQVNFHQFQKFMELFCGTTLSDEYSKKLFQFFHMNAKSARIPGGDEIPVTGEEYLCLKDIACHLSLLEGGGPEDKLQFVFNLYDADGNGYLDSCEMERIVNQMMHVAQHLGWNIAELRPILNEMLQEIDYDKDGVVTLQEWIQGGMTTTPLLVLLGLENSIRDDGSHAWRIKHFNLPAYCNLCERKLVGLGKQGLSCAICKYTAHERCVDRVPHDCVQTYNKNIRESQDERDHVWIQGNNEGPCHECKKKIKSHQGLVGKHCRWCQLAYHDKCFVHASKICTLGSLHTHILPPWTIAPKILNNQKIKSRNNSCDDMIDCDLGKDTEAVTKIDMANGDGKSLQITPLPNTKPLLVFINPKSGGKLGAKLFLKMQSILNPRQVFNLSKGGPNPGLNFFSDLKNFRVLCCGGDGTVGWILDSIDKNQIEPLPPVAILPLGTGNDLARCMRWGGGYDGGNINKILQQIQQSSSVMMDRWCLDVTSDPCTNQLSGDPVPLSIMNNYFSIGVDASICRKFHVMREKHPHKFNSRMKNKLWYSAFGTTETFSASCKKLYENLEVTVDGVKLESWSKGHFQGIAILNIPSVYGGTNLWGPTKKQKGKSKVTGNEKPDIKYAAQEMGDQKLEIVGVDGAMEVGQIITGLKAGKRLAQGSDIEITTKKLFPMQVDGEPWMQVPCKICIKHKNQVPMLMGPGAEESSILSIFKKGNPSEESA